MFGIKGRSDGGVSYCTTIRRLFNDSWPCSCNTHPTHYLTKIRRLSVAALPYTRNT